MEIITDIMLSNRHCHLSKEAAKTLFGDEGITIKNYTNDSKAEWAANETVTIAGSKGSLDKVRVLGPLRNQVQVEVLAGDNYKLGIKAPVKMSGDLDEAETVRIIGPCGEIEAKCAIVAQRHIHMGYETAAELGIDNSSEVSVKTDGIRGLVFDHVAIRVSKRVARDCMMHIDTEEGNAAGLKNHDKGVVLT